MASTSPPAAVLLSAPANVLHGAVREQGFASSPIPETQVRVAIELPSPQGLHFHQSSDLTQRQACKRTDGPPAPWRLSDRFSYHRSNVAGEAIFVANPAGWKS